VAYELEKTNNISKCPGENLHNQQIPKEQKVTVK
jgi:hypothetical protein